MIAPAGSAERTDGAAKLADHDDKRLVQKPAGFHVAQHRSDAVVERLAHGVQVIAARILRAVRRAARLMQSGGSDSAMNP